MKKIIILTSKGGYGHMAACATLKTILYDYELIIINPFERLFAKRDLLKMITFGKVDGEDVYNKLFQGGWIGVLNFVCRYLIPIFMPLYYPFFKRQFYKLYEQEKPDLVISVIPLLNYPGCAAAKKFGIPFILITLDADLRLWLLDLQKCLRKKFNLTVACTTEFISAQLEEYKIPKHYLKQVGFPIRKEFFEPKDKIAIAKQWNIPEDKQIIMLMMGGAGSSNQLRYVNYLLGLNLNVHILVCIGRNIGITPQLNLLQKKARNTTLTIISFTQHIADLMYVSNLLITKPGPNTCNEAMFYGLPMLIDMTMPHVFWEKRTLDWINAFGKGTVVNKLSDLSHLVPHYLAEKVSHEQREKFAQLPKFDTSIRTLVSTMLANDWNDLNNKVAVGIKLEEQKARDKKLAQQIAGEAQSR